MLLLESTAALGSSDSWAHSSEATTDAITEAISDANHRGDSSHDSSEADMDLLGASLGALAVGGAEAMDLDERCGSGSGGCGSEGEWRSALAQLRLGRAGWFYSAHT